MGPTPLYDALRAFAGQGPLRMHMPGHKGKDLPLSGLSGAAALDVTELGPTGDLFAGGGPIAEAERLWAEAFHMGECLFLTGGSTQGMHAALLLACRPGERVLIDRGCHRSVYHALAVLDLRPVYLRRPWLERPGVLGAVFPEDVERMLEEHADIKTVCITSPTYYGILSDVSAIAAVVHRHGGRLVVDGAHGAHLPFLGVDYLNGADLAVASAHKTLPALGQGALLLAGGGIAHEELRRAGSVYGSSSPSYLLMAAMDACRGWMEGEGARRYRETAEYVRHMRTALPALTEEWGALDPTRLTACTAGGIPARRALEAQGIYVEMADAGHVVCICTCMDSREELARLERALAGLPQGRGRAVAPPPLPEQALSPRQALFAPRQALPLAQCAGRVSAQQIAPYPPGVPVVAPGERIEKKTVAYFQQIGYNMVEGIQTVAPQCV